MIAKQVDAMDLTDMARHFYQRLGKRLWGRWTWRMRRGEMDLIPVQLLLGKGNQPQKILACERPDASLLLQSSSSGCRN